jgi:hypothetical protein
MNHEHCPKDLSTAVTQLRLVGADAVPFVDMLEGHKVKLTEHYESLRVATSEVPPNKDTMAALKSTIESALVTLKVDSSRISKAFGIVKPKAKAKAKGKKDAEACEDEDQLPLVDGTA